jgi:hypothetical protein
MNRLVFYVTTRSGTGGSPTARFLLYQAPGGLSRDSSNLVALIGQVTAFNIPSTGIFAAAFDAAATIAVESGLLYVLFARDSGTGVGSFNLRSYAMANTDLLVSNVDADTHPVRFTSVLASALPATFDPRNNPPGQATPAGVTDTSPVIRFKKV